MDFITDIAPADLVGIKLLGESGQFAIYGCGQERYLLVQRHAGTPWTGLLFSGDGVFRLGGLLAEAMRDSYREMAAQLSPLNQREPAFESRVSAVVTQGYESARERPDLYADDLTEERQISPVLREKIAASLRLDPIDGSGDAGQPLTRGQQRRLT